MPGVLRKREQTRWGGLVFLLCGFRLPRALALASLLVFSLGVPTKTLAKEVALSSPSGKRIYGPHETFAQVLDQDTRDFVAEVAVGAGPEGNLGILLGWLNQPINRMEWYVGFGLEANPARNATLAVRQTFNIDGFRPYVGLGYMFRRTLSAGTASHNVFAEVGHSWVLHKTYRLTLGLGLRRILRVYTVPGSILEGPEIDREFRDEQLERVYPWLPTLALRFSRAF